MSEHYSAQLQRMQKNNKIEAESIMTQRQIIGEEEDQSLSLTSRQVITFLEKPKTHVQEDSKSEEGRRANRIVVWSISIMFIIVLAVFIFGRQKNPSESQNSLSNMNQDPSRTIFNHSTSTSLQPSPLYQTTKVQMVPFKPHKLVTAQSSVYSNPSLSFYLKKRKGIFVQMVATFRKQLAEKGKSESLKLQQKEKESEGQNIQIGENESIENNPTATTKTTFDKLEEAQLTAYQFQLSLRLLAHSPFLYPPKNKEQQSILAEQKAHYNLSTVYTELPFCIVVPSYKNHQRFRYFFNLYSLLQQHYTNYRVVIVDDHSEDHTYQDILKEIKGNKNAEKRVILIENEKRVSHMANIYKAVHGYCSKGEILLVVDGDDQLVGTQVLNLLNKAYHQKKPMALYTNHIQSKRQTTVDVGISRQYSPETRQNNTYRYQRHYYSHLRSCWTDLFLLLPASTFQNSKGEWFTNAVDNAIFYPVFELSCGEVIYLPEITYKYNTYTGNNVDNVEEDYRRKTSQEIKGNERQRCLKQWNADEWDIIKGYVQ